MEVLSYVFYYTRTAAFPLYAMQGTSVDTACQRKHQNDVHNGTWVSRVQGKVTKCFPTSVCYRIPLPPPGTLPSSLLGQLSQKVPSLQINLPYRICLYPSPLKDAFQQSLVLWK